MFFKIITLKFDSGFFAILESSKMHVREGKKWVRFVIHFDPLRINATNEVVLHHGYPWLCKANNGYPLFSGDIHGSLQISMVNR